MVRRIVVINDFSVARGGATALALLSLRLFRAQNIPVTYVVGDDGNNPLFSEIGVDVIALGGHAIDAGNRFQGVIKGFYNRSARMRMAKWIHDNDNPDTVYHVHGWSKILSPYIFSALKPVSARTVVHAHDFFLVCPNGSQFHFRNSEPCYLTPLSVECLTTNCDKRSYSDKLWRSAREVFLRSLLADFTPNYPKIILIHEKMTPYFVRAGISQTQLRVIQNPVTPFSRQRVTVENNKFIYFIGRLEPEKGILDAIQAARIARLPLKVIGDGPLYREYKQSYSDVDFLGWQSPLEIGKIIQDARIVVMPTRYPEPFGLVALEAAYSGIPVVMSDTAFQAENFTRQQIGFTCDPRDHNQFASLLRKLTEMSSSELMRLSLSMVQLSAENMITPEIWRDALLACYNENECAPELLAF